MSTEQTPRPVFDVLREHRYVRPAMRPAHCAPAVVCARGDVIDRLPGESDEVAAYRHLADALAAEGYPVTAEGLADGLAAAWDGGRAAAVADNLRWNYGDPAAPATPNPYRQEKTHG